MHSRELYEELIAALTLPLSDGEKQATVQWLVEERCGLSATDFIKGKDVSQSPRHFEKDMKRLNAGEPLQYILGYAEFYGQRFRVNKSVLIPRPETELLVQHLADTLGKEFNGTVVDIGTGSGCIAITLALHLPRCTVKATDVDSSVLAVAKENARDLKVSVEFHKHDILGEELPFIALGAVISNPPYVRENERKSMPRSVIGFEPHKALFVPDENALIFHRAIAQKARSALVPGGLLAMEINEAMGLVSKEMLERDGFAGVRIHKDLDGKDRFITAWMPK